MGSQFLPVSDDPTKVLRTKTKGIGTDNYRAPEVNAGIHSYDPSAADIWSLGVTLFFLVSFKECGLHVLHVPYAYWNSRIWNVATIFAFPM